MRLFKIEADRWSQEYPEYVLAKDMAQAIKIFTKEYNITEYSVDFDDHFYVPNAKTSYDVTDLGDCRKARYIK